MTEIASVHGSSEAPDAPRAHLRPGARATSCATRSRAATGSASSAAATATTAIRGWRSSRRRAAASRRSWTDERHARRRRWPRCARGACLRDERTAHPASRVARAASGWARRSTPPISPRLRAQGDVELTVQVDRARADRAHRRDPRPRRGADARRRESPRDAGALGGPGRCAPASSSTFASCRRTAARPGRAPGSSSSEAARWN